MARLLFLGASISQLPAIGYAKLVGHEVVACDGDPHAVAFDRCDVAEAVDFSDVDRVTAVGRRERVDGVLAICTDRAVVPAALVAERLGLPGIDPGVAHAMTHKPTMRRLISAAGLPQPTHCVLTAESTELADVQFPAVLKPADSGGQRGLFRIGSVADLSARLPDALAASRGGEALLEEFIDGSELNTLFAVRDGEPTLLTVSDRLRPGGPGFGVGWIHRYPSELSPAAIAEVVDVAAASIRALGLRDGIAFPQVIASPRGVYVVEVAARIAAGQMADLVRYGTGIELFEIAIAQALGEPVTDSLVVPRFERPIAIRFLTAAPGHLPVGRVTAIRNLDDVRMAEGVVDAGLYFQEGADIGPLRVDADRRGYVIATGATAAEALVRADAAAAKLRVEVEKSKGHRALFLSLALCLLALAAASAALVWVTSPSPSGLTASVAARLHDTGGRQVRLRAISPLLRDAVVATEDERFYSHHGVDVIGVMRALPFDVTHLSFAQGASTITEQVAKVLYLDGNDHSPWRKLQDAAIAWKLENRDTKAQILAAYLNSAYFGEGAHGAWAAAERYFGVSPGKLNVAQASLLAGLIQAPTRYDPFQNPVLARDRQVEVLRSMVRSGYLTVGQATATIGRPLRLLAGATLPAVRGVNLAPPPAFVWWQLVLGAMLVLVALAALALRRVWSPSPDAIGSLAVRIPLLAAVVMGAIVIVRSFRSV